MPRMVYCTILYVCELRLQLHAYMIARKCRRSGEGVESRATFQGGQRSRPVVSWYI